MKTGLKKSIALVIAIGLFFSFSVIFADEGSKQTGAYYSQTLKGGKPAKKVPAYNVPGNRGAALSFIEMEAEAAVSTGTIVGPDTTPGTPANEASGRSFVKLEKAGQFVEFTTAKPANSIVIRYNIPDAEKGGGITASIGLYINGVYKQDIVLTSKYCWNYGTSRVNDPSAGNPGHFFDESRALTGDIPAGAKIRLQAGDKDAAAYYNIDLIDLEQVGPAFSKPADYLSIADFGAIPDDGKDDTQAIVDTIKAAKSRGKGVWIPEGTFNRTLGPVKTSGIKGATGYVSGMENTGAIAKIKVTEKSSVKAETVIRYYNDSGITQTLTLSVNGKKLGVITFEAPRKKNWADKKIIFDLKAGDNEISLIHGENDTGKILLDAMTVNQEKAEMEDALLTCPITVDNVSIKGAGMWHSILEGCFSHFVLNGDNTRFSDFAVLGATDSRNDALNDNAFSGTGGKNSCLNNIWIEHTKYGFLVGDSTISRTDNLQIINCRIRNTMADGVNFCDGTIHSLISNCSIRNTGGDGLAVWSAPYNHPDWGCDKNTIRNNTIQQPWIAQGVALYGGADNSALDNMIYDIPASAGILVSTAFDCVPFSGTTTIARNSIVRAGAITQKSGGFRIMCEKQKIMGLDITDLDIYDSTDAGIRFTGSKVLTGTTFSQVHINYCNTYGIFASSEVKGSITMNNVMVQNADQGGIKNDGTLEFKLGYFNQGW